MSSMKLSWDEVIDLRRNRATWADIADIAGVRRETISKMAKANPDFPRELLRFMNPMKQVASDDIKMMMDEGLSDMQIANMLGMKVESFSKLRVRRGLRRREKVGAPRRTPEDIARMGELLDEGYSYTAVAEFLRAAHRTVRKHYPNRGFTNQQSVQAAVMSRKLNELEVRRS